MTWYTTESGCRRGRAFTDGLEALGQEMDRKWGIGRLRLLVSADLRAKFDRQLAKTQHAIVSGDSDALEREVQRMETAWRTLDRLATEAGHDPLAPEVWEVPVGTGVVAVVRNQVEALHVRAEGRDVTVYTLEELVALLDALPGVAAVKEHFEGAKVLAAREHVPLQPEPWATEGGAQNVFGAG